MQESPAWADTFVSRLAALALMQSLNANILSSPSATLSLEKWCRDHKLAREPKIVARSIRNGVKAPTTEQRKRLQINNEVQVKYRRVQLHCGDKVLSEAENWYVPSRLTEEMNRLLDTSETPFGKVVQPLGPYRRTFATKMLWAPLPEGWELEPPRSSPGTTNQLLAIPDALFEHHALLYSREHKPFAEVYEIYQRQLLAFPHPRAY
ncbi:MAG TPA: hypothetical protein VEF04_15530 [Blastocatellia bacterium]|nr:hypothetical protein [Blastocatellia bacterium]